LSWTSTDTPSFYRNSALPVRSDHGAGDKGGERPVVGLDLGQGHRLTRSIHT
jgi:hypothetical protein